MKLTLTREQIPLAEGTIKALCVEGAILPAKAPTLPGWNEWYRDILTDASWADALEAAIKEAGGAQANDMFCMSAEGDERAFWQSACLQSLRSGETGERAVNAADQALAGYRKAFCTGMPSDQKGAK